MHLVDDCCNCCLHLSQCPSSVFPSDYNQRVVRVTNYLYAIRDGHVQDRVESYVQYIAGSQAQILVKLLASLFVREVTTFLAVGDGSLREVATYDPPQIGSYECSSYLFPGRELNKCYPSLRCRRYRERCNAMYRLERRPGPI